MTDFNEKRLITVNDNDKKDSRVAVAIDHFRIKALQDPDNPFPWLERAFLHDDLEELEAALQCWKEVHHRLRTPLKMIWWLLTRGRIPTYKGAILASFVRGQIRSLECELKKKDTKNLPSKE